MKFFYQSGAMGFYGEGYLWHRVMPKFPEFEFVTKTITYNKKNGLQFAVAFLPFFGKSVWNKTSLHNPGLRKWIFGNKCNGYNKPNMIISITGTDEEIQRMCRYIDSTFSLGNIAGIEINMSCPNVKQTMFQSLPKTIHPLFLKVRYDTDLRRFAKYLHRVKRIHLNSVPGFKGAISGEVAKFKNWAFIDKWQGAKGIPPIAGASWTCIGDIYDLHIEHGCEYIGIGSQMLTMPSDVRKLNRMR